MIFVLLRNEALGRRSPKLDILYFHHPTLLSGKLFPSLPPPSKKKKTAKNTTQSPQFTPQPPPTSPNLPLPPSPPPPSALPPPKCHPLLSEAPPAGTGTSARPARRRRAPPAPATPRRSGEDAPPSPGGVDKNGHYKLEEAQKKICRLWGGETDEYG